MILTVMNQKGGVGKTTTVINLGVYLAHAGKKVLLVDLDPQANLTSGLGVDVHKDRPTDITGRESKQKTVYDLLVNSESPEEIIVPSSTPGLEVLPSGIELSGAEVEMVNMMSRENVLKTALQRIEGNYDLILIDCPPSLGILTVNALTAANKILIPIQCEYFALEGLGQLMNTIKIVKSKLNPNLEIGGVILTMFDNRTNLSRDVATEVRAFFKEIVFTSVIPRNIRLSEAPSHGQSIHDYDPQSAGAKSYSALSEEVIARFLSSK